MPILFLSSKNYSVRERSKFEVLQHDLCAFLRNSVRSNPNSKAIWQNVWYLLNWWQLLALPVNGFQVFNVHCDIP